MGSNHNDISGIFPASYQGSTATYQDAMGIYFYAPEDDGDWKVTFLLSLDFICTSSDGNTITGKHLDFNYSGQIHF